MSDLHTLVLDDDEGQLGPLAVRLVRSGVDVFYAKFEDEARLMLRQRDSHVRALIVTPQVDPKVARRLFEEATGPDGSGARAMIAVGAKPRPDVCARLRAAGVEWVLFGRHDDAELRFVLNTAVALPDPIAPRREPRAPTTAFVWIRIGSSRCFGVFYSLSARGGFVETPSPLPKGSRLDLEFDLDGRHYRLQGEVIYRNDPRELASRHLPPGMGVLFQKLHERDETALRAWCAERGARYRI